jgi:hypothetical protein
MLHVKAFDRKTILIKPNRVKTRLGVIRYPLMVTGFLRSNIDIMSNRQINCKTANHLSLTYGKSIISRIINNFKWNVIAQSG